MKKIIVLMLVFICGAVSAEDILYQRSLFGQDAVKILDEGKIIYSESEKTTPAFLEGATRITTFWDVIYEKNMWFCIRHEIVRNDVNNLKCIETIYKK